VIHVTLTGASFDIHRVMAHAGQMVALVFGMLLCVVLAVAVVGVVAIPARRQGRDLLTPKGEEVVAMVREKTGSAVETAIEKTGGAMGAARDKVAEVTSPKDD
jgi:hypothetical protein